MILGISYFTSTRGNCLLQRPSPQGLKTSTLLFPFAPSLPHRLRTICWLPFMSLTHTTTSSNFQLIINNALDNYKKCTKNDLTTHPLAAQLQSCKSPSDILAVLRQQVYELDQSRSTDERWSRWLDPTVNVIYVLSSTLAAGFSMVCLKT